MKKVLTILVCLVLVFTVTSLVTGCQPSAQTPSVAPSAAATTAAPATTAAEKPLKIAFFVSTMNNGFHQAQAVEAKRYAKEKYNADVYIFDGKSDGTVMTQNIDQIVAQGMDMASLHIWDQEAAKPGVLAAIQKGVIINTFFSPLSDTGIPIVRSDEPAVSEEMGKQMATQWKAAHPDKPVVCVELGWPNHTEVKSGRTDPFVKGVKSVDPKAVDLGCLDASKGADAAKQIIKDLCSQHPEVNVIYSESSDVNVGTMAGLTEAGRGKMDNGKPLTEIVCSCDFDKVQIAQLYDPNCSLKLSLGLPPIETARARIDNLFDVKNGKIKLQDVNTPISWAKAYCISFWTMKQADAQKWCDDEFNVK